ncbi:MAG: aldose 1-epimerase [Actinomycetia bacterium]|nr:aldose 1-epimerase [Actinomycetes bacterium]
MTPPLTLETADARLVIDPDAGGRAASLVVEGLELLTRGGPDPVQWGWYPMAPWPGRLRDNAFRHAGRTHRMPPTFDGWAIHGTVYDATWRVEEQTASSVALAADLGPPWPWPGLVRLTWALEPGRLTTTVAVETTAPAFPAEVGWHPWFRRQLAVGAPAVLDLPAEAMAERGADHLPTGRLVPVPSGPYDDAFHVPGGRVGITWPGALALTCTSDCRWFVVFDELPGAVCVEPQTAAPDSLNADPYVVRPDRPRTARAEWAWRSA